MKYDLINANFTTQSVFKFSYCDCPCIYVVRLMSRNVDQLVHSILITHPDPPFRVRS